MRVRSKGRKAAGWPKNSSFDSRVKKKGPELIDLTHVGPRSNDGELNILIVTYSHPHAITCDLYINGRIQYDNIK